MKLLRKIWSWIISIFSTPKEKEGIPPVVPEIEIPEGTPSIKEPVENLVIQKGFDPNFLPLPVNLPKIEGTPDSLLHYRHFSVAMNAARRMPYYTAVNIDALKYNKLKPLIPSRKAMGSDTWIIDQRYPKTAQLPKSFYSDNDFDLGHMVRREYVLWGDTLEEALAANDDTFYLTNATPQHKDFNRNAARWKGLEDYALKHARQNDLRVSAFTGCVFDEEDRKHKGVQIPAKFWKILIMVKQNGELSATGYIVQQDDLIESITERNLDFQYEQFKTYQVPLTKIEEMTGLQFGLNDHDPIQKTRGIFMSPVEVEDYENITF